jgi:hydrogenase expression/formation protein HypE
LEKIMTRILPGHGSGGKLMNDMISSVIRHILGEDSVQMDDSAILEILSDKIAFTTDSFVITPIFFPGGDIGGLAVNGTVNDLAVMGAVPKYISCALILEEGLAIDDLKRVLVSMREAADLAGVRIVTGDTKVVGRGKGDMIYINTSGIGIFESRPQRGELTPGDRIIINGSAGDHGAAVMGARSSLSFSKGLVSDCAALNGMIKSVTDKFPDSVKFMRDATRGGIASVLNELTQGKGFGAKLIEEDIPVKDEVRGFCDILGIDPLYAANEGKAIFIVKREDADEILNLIRADKNGRDGAVIGEITSEFPGKTFIETEIGGKRILPLQIEEQLPRIC